MIVIECGVCGSIIGRAATQSEVQQVMKDHRAGCSLTGGWFK